jgi:hypothetical protein
MNHHGGPPGLDNINDPRNGLLLELSIDRIFGHGEVVFLKVITIIIRMQVFIAKF